MPSIATAKRAVMRGAERLGVDGQVKHLRALTNRGLRRDLRDHAALRLLIAGTVPRDAHTVDVGCNRGDVLGELIRVAPAGRHIAYEPIPALAEDLRRRFPQAEIRNVALADTTGASTFQHVTDADGYSGLLRRALPPGAHVDEITVRVERLDDTLPDGFAPAFIKIDVEGGELAVLRGARDTIDRHRPIVVFESGKGSSDYYGTTPDMLYDLLVEDCGMRIFDLAGEGPYGRERLRETFNGNTKQPVWNYVACP
jgi:FkbM family methyltransferase